MQNLKLTITQFNNYVKNIFDAEELLIGVSVFGEVSNYKCSGGNAYFDIKEEGAQLSCIEFGAVTDIKNGDSVIVTGRPNYHVRLGKFSFVATKIEMFGMGELYAQFLALKSKLEKEGIFDEQHKIGLTKYAIKIGVVASETGAVIHDIINVARHKNPYVDIVLYPAKVQGIGAENEIAEGIKYLDSCADVDTIIVARGGGSFEDLSPFNTEIVARAVFECKKPIVSGVGHETDFTLCDFASDMRAPTPSVASDLCVFDYYAEVEKIGQILSNNQYFVDEKVKNGKSALIDILEDGQRFIKTKILNFKNIIDTNLFKTQNLTENILRLSSLKANMVSAKLEALNPMSILKRGYSKISISGAPVFSIKNVKVGEEIENRVADGKILSKIIKIDGEQL